MSRRPDNPIRTWLDRAPTGGFVAYSIFAAFVAYFSMYAFRKPFAAAEFEGLQWFGGMVGLKEAIVASQLLGYAASKWLGIKICSELNHSRRGIFLVGVITIAELSLLLYGAAPHDWKFLPIAVNGLVLGMVWGVVTSFLEGRHTSEMLLAGLSCSYIMASGVVKDFGLAIMAGEGASWWHGTPFVSAPLVAATGPVSEGWMPFVAGLHYLPLFLFAVLLLKQLPEPSAEEQVERVKRTNMDRSSRWEFLRRYGLGLFLLITAYFLLTAYRDFRDNFQVELFSLLGYGEEEQNLLGNSETVVAFVVTGGMMLLYWLRGVLHRNGLFLVFSFMGLGLVTLFGASALFQAGTISGFTWMVCTGIGVYLTYVPFGSVLFDEIIASTHFVGTAVFAIYLCDAVGYSGAVLLYFFRDAWFGNLDKLEFFTAFTWLMAIIGLVAMIAAYLYFRNKVRKAPAVQ